MDKLHSTPANKRPFTDMSFSPEGASLASIAQLLDQKLKPLYDEIREAVQDSKKCAALKSEIDTLKEENRELHKKIDELENYSRRNNIRIYNLPEQPGEEIESVLLEKFNMQLDEAMRFNARTFENVHRIGKMQQGKNRVVIARFSYLKDKAVLMNIKHELKVKQGVGISDDFSSATIEKRNALFPLCKAMQKKASTETGGAPVKIYLKKDKIALDGKLYGPDDLERLPDKYQPKRLFTQQQENITAFFTKYSPLSNHFLRDFKIDGERYNCVEQYLMCKKANLFGDQESAVKIYRTKDPVTQKQIGKHVKNFEAKVWAEQSSSILHKGLTAKFQQNSDLLEFLMNTGDSCIAEASADKMFGIGLRLSDPKLWDKSNWIGKNKQGQALENVRAALQ